MILKSRSFQSPCPISANFIFHACFNAKLWGCARGIIARAQKMQFKMFRDGGRGGFGHSVLQLSLS